MLWRVFGLRLINVRRYCPFFVFAVCYLKSRSGRRRRGGFTTQVHCIEVCERKCAILKRS